MRYDTRDRKDVLPRHPILNKAQFHIAASSLARRVLRRQMAYSHAETILLQQRCGKAYERLDQAESEAKWTLIGFIDRRDGNRRFEPR